MAKFHDLRLDCGCLDIDLPIKNFLRFEKHKYRHRKGGWIGTLNNSAGWTSVEVTGKIMDKIGPILATKYLEIN
mgnify:CR=1 FL=1